MNAARTNVFLSRARSGSIGIGASCAFAFHPLHVSLTSRRLRLVIVVANEIAESQFLPSLAGEGLEAVGNLNGQPAKIFSDVLQHVLSGETVELN